MHRRRWVERKYLEPIQVPETSIGGIYSTLNKKRGMVFSEEQKPGTPLFVIKSYLPVNESFGFTEELRGNTSGQAFPQSVFDHWEMMQGNPLETGDWLNKLVLDIRKRKGLKLETPVLSNYLDKL